MAGLWPFRAIPFMATAQPQVKAALIVTDAPYETSIASTAPIRPQDAKTSARLASPASANLPALSRTDSFARFAFSRGECSRHFGFCILN
jgi:hypothetical protein